MRKRAFEVVALVLALLPGARVMAQETDFYLPQIADGQGQGLTIRTTFVLFNPTARAAGFSLIITDDQGNPLAVTLPGLGTDSSFQFSLGAGETRLLETGGEGVLRTGAAVVTAESNVGVSAVFRIAGSGGAFITEAGVGASTPQTRFVLPVDTTGRFNTGVALFNFGGLGSDVTFQLYDTEGRPGLTSTANLPAGSHQARFVAGEGELFPTIGNFRGTMVVTSSRPVAAVVLRQNLDTFTSTTLPVVPANSQLHDFLLPQIANGPYAGGSIKTSFILFNVSNTNADVAGEPHEGRRNAFSGEHRRGSSIQLQSHFEPERSGFCGYGRRRDALGRRCSRDLECSDRRQRDFHALRSSEAGSRQKQV